jgi:hypothetical protein
VPATLPVALPPLPHLADHRIAGKATLPAVELLEIMTAAVASAEGWSEVLPLPLAMREVVFPRFLPADEIERCTFTITLEHWGRDVRASLRSRIALPGGLARSRTHAEATIGGAALPPPPLPTFAPDFELVAERVYRELVPFGPRYRNLQGVLRLGPDGASGTVRSPTPPCSTFSSPSSRLGCPFLLDAAMHLACVWGQRYTGVVAYPMAFAARVLYQPTPAGERRCLVAPTRVEARRLECDLWLVDDCGEVCDAVTGLVMSPLAAGAVPPAWITLAGKPT